MFNSPSIKTRSALGPKLVLILVTDHSVKFNHAPMSIIHGSGHLDSTATFKDYSPMHTNEKFPVRRLEEQLPHIQMRHDGKVTRDRDTMRR